MDNPIIVINQSNIFQIPKNNNNNNFINKIMNNNITNLIPQNFQSFDQKIRASPQIRIILIKLIDIYFLRKV